MLLAASTRILAADTARSGVAANPPNRANKHQETGLKGWKSLSNNISKLFFYAKPNLQNA